MEGLSDEMKDELPHSLSHHATGTDYIKSAHGWLPGKPPPSLEPLSSHRPMATSPSRSVIPSGTVNDSQPLQLGADWPRMTPKQKVHLWYLNLCLYCGETGHFSATCPAKYCLPPPPKDLPEG